MMVSIVVAAAGNDVIGRDGTLPWYLPEDLRRFRALTTGHVVVMGRVTYQSIVARLGHPLPGRTCVVVSSTMAPAAGGPQVHVTRSPQEALRVAGTLAEAAGDTEFFVIGGESVYRHALPLAGRVYLTRVHLRPAGDRAMPPGWLDGFQVTSCESGTDPRTGTTYEFLRYERAAA